MTLSLAPVVGFPRFVLRPVLGHSSEQVVHANAAKKNGVVVMAGEAVPRTRESLLAMGTLPEQAEPLIFAWDAHLLLELAGQRGERQAGALNGPKVYHCP
eukprot:CAMPEP_0119069190 /NCGR_PEP_ID=MMETSP1178-20130426/11694_1 /TAXON_ID=33656 /ORGANISM="unid sp, Strain CCMP2000" /LENGTH=99 /DNA_ID=CAMNT_0007050929 /DNA_START=32 /DNA_END=327 /DNA_ORIENTATION=-